MKHLAVLVVPLALAGSPAPAPAEGGKGIDVAFMARTRTYETHQSIAPATPGEVVLVIRIEGAAVEDVRGEGKPFVQFDGQTRKTSYVETAGKATIVKDGRSVTIEPWLVLAFVVPEKTAQLSLTVSNHPSVSVSVPSEVLARLSQFDVR
jgi:hypothetical protein